MRVDHEARCTVGTVLIEIPVGAAFIRIYAGRGPNRLGTSVTVILSPSRTVKTATDAWVAAIKLTDIKVALITSIVVGII